jgi:6-pyruvoyltetrahydropterin/6-carboxytetrahydropterin synthase
MKKSSSGLHLAKQNFKFSAAHFLIFDSVRAERLHGHNYQVRVDLSFLQNEALMKAGFIVDFKVLKDDIKSIVDSLDEFVLLPAQHPDFTFSKQGQSLSVKFRDRNYLFPETEVRLLEMTNTSVENLSKFIAEKLASKWKSLPIHKLRVRVEETQGQAASTTLLCE